MYLILYINVCRYTYFVKQQRLKDSQCLLLAHHQPNSPSVSRTELNCKSVNNYYVHHVLLYVSWRPV